MSARLALGERGPGCTLQGRRKGGCWLGVSSGDLHRGRIPGPVPRRARAVVEDSLDSGRGLDDLGSVSVRHLLDRDLLGGEYIGPQNNQQRFAPSSHPLNLRPNHLHDQHRPLSRNSRRVQAGPLATSGAPVLTSSEIVRVPGPRCPRTRPSRGKWAAPRAGIGGIVRAISFARCCLGRTLSLSTHSLTRGVESARGSIPGSRRRLFPRENGLPMDTRITRVFPKR